MYKVLWDSAAVIDLKQLEKNIARKIINKITSYLISDPINLGRPLSNNLNGLMRYRFGDYRIIYEIDKPNVRGQRQ